MISDGPRKVGPKEGALAGLPRRRLFGPGVKELARVARIEMVVGDVPASACGDEAGRKASGGGLKGSEGRLKTAKGRGDRPAVLAAKKGVDEAPPNRTELGAAREVPNGADKAGPSDPKPRGGRPKTVGEPWKALDPPISKAEYYRRKKAGAL